MATTNPYTIEPECDFVNHAPLSALNFFKCAALTDPESPSAIQGSKHYTRKENDNRCRPRASPLSQRGIGKTMARTACTAKPAT